ncbi:MAG: hypothetical protein HY648_04605 [Acidobacteria bacterium]|nr:hypothetical protein [Acidobacteriota bacterium]
MSSTKFVLLAMLAAILAAPWAVEAVGRARPAAQGREETPKRESVEQAISSIVRQMQMDLEGSSVRGIVNNIDSAKFDDYPRFEDMVERLTRENSLRVFFRQVSSSIRENSAQTILDAEMEMTRKDSAGQAERRRQQLVIDFELTSRGWKIINITPREFFRPL